MQIVNDYDNDLYNGNIGMIEDVDACESEVAVNVDGRTGAFGEFDTLVAAQSASLEKSLGFEYLAWGIPVMIQDYAVLQCNFI